MTRVRGGLTSVRAVGTLMLAFGAFGAELNGDVAQLGERCLRTAEVGSSNLLVSTKELTSGRPECGTPRRLHHR